MTDTIVLTPTWESVMPQLLAVIANPKAPAEAKAHAESALMGLARAADKVRAAS